MRAVAGMLRGLALSLALLAAPAAAQQAETLAPVVAPVDFEAWDAFAGKVEDTLEAGNASEALLEQQRGEVIAWRAELLRAQSVGATRIATLREQIDALGPAPAEGETEAEDIAARRTALGEQLSAAQAPGLRAVEAWGRADAIVTQIDRTLRERQTLALRRLSPSPLLPDSWNAAADEAALVAREIGSDMVGAWRAPAPASRLVVVLGLLAAAALILTRGRQLVDRMPQRLSGMSSEASRAVVAFVASLAQIVLPLAGVWLVVLGLRAAGFGGPWTGPLLAALPQAGAVFFVGRWIAAQMFPLNKVQRPGPLALPPEAAKKARRAALWLALALALHRVLVVLGVPVSGLRGLAAPAGEVASAGLPVALSEAAAGVWHLPLIVLAALALWRLGGFLRDCSRLSGVDPVPTHVKLTQLLGHAARLVAILAPVAAAAGYVAAANAALWPMVATLGVVGIVLLLQEFIVDLWSLLGRKAGSGQEALAPVLIGFALALAALPVLALIWGARPSELAEVWTRLSSGVRVGDVRLSPGAVVTFFAVFAIGYVLTRGAQGALRTSVLPKTRIESGAAEALVSGLGYIGIFAAALTAILSAGFDLSSLAIVAGALSVGIGFGLQNIVSNFVSGIILLIERPITVGDWIAVGGAQGFVRRISVRSTQIETFDRTTVIVPNGDLITKEVTNWTRGSASGRIIVPVGVAYGSDTRRVEEILREIAEAQPTVLFDPEPIILFTGFGADSLDFEIRAILSDITAGVRVASEIRHQITERFEAEGIEVPFAQLDVHLKKPNPALKPLRRGGAPASPRPDSAPGSDAMPLALDDGGDAPSQT